MDDRDWQGDRRTRARAIADALIEAYDDSTMVAPITATEPGFDLAAAYDVLHHIEAARIARGWRPVGRKIGFTNRTIWSRYGVSGPMWARMWDRTVRFAGSADASLELAAFVQPRIEPEVVFSLAGQPRAGDDVEEILSCVQWVAAGFELVQCPFPDWRFTAPDCTAAFGLHGALVVGTPVAVTDHNRSAIAGALATFVATLSCDGAVVEHGTGANVLGSPALALSYLATTTAAQSQFSPLAGGEVITTGTLTDAWPVEPGQRWESNYGSLGIEGLSVTFR